MAGVSRLLYTSDHITSKSLLSWDFLAHFPDMDFLLGCLASRPEGEVALGRSSCRVSVEEVEMPPVLCGLTGTQRG